MLRNGLGEAGGTDPVQTPLKETVLVLAGME